MSIRAQVTVIAQPASFESWASDFPPLELDETLDYWSISLQNRQLQLKVPLSVGQPWRKTEQGRPEIFVEQLPLIVIDSTHWFDLRAWIVFHEGSPRTVPDVRVWAENNLVLAGGQFESSRRRH